jgi:serine protease DegQ
LAESFELSGTSGALIAGVLKGGPADRAGVKPGDVLMKVNGNQVVDSSSLLNLIAALKPGEQAMLTVARKRQVMEFSVKVEKRPPQPRQTEDVN